MPATGGGGAAGGVWATAIGAASVATMMAATVPSALIARKSQAIVLQGPTGVKWGLNACTGRLRYRCFFGLAR